MRSQLRSPISSFFGPGFVHPAFFPEWRKNIAGGRYILYISAFSFFKTTSPGPGLGSITRKKCAGEEKFHFRDDRAKTTLLEIVDILYVYVCVIDGLIERDGEGFFFNFSFGKWAGRSKEGKKRFFPAYFRGSRERNLTFIEKE